MPKLTETEMLRHVDACTKDACKLYKCDKKDVHVTVLPNDNVMIRLKDAAQKERRE